MSLSSQSKPPSMSSQVADSGKIVMGAGMRLPAAPTHTTDPGKITFGAGMRMPTERKPA